MKNGKLMLQVAFTYIGTIVGAGFATGQEIMEFFTQYGGMAAMTIFFSCVLFIWIGTKLMLISHYLQAKSYEDLNIYLFGPLFGKAISLLILAMLLAISSVMLAGAGSLFMENLGLPYQFGLIITSLLAYAVIARGIHGIMAVNTIVVPFMLVYTFIILFHALDSPQATNWYLLPNLDEPIWRVWLSPFLYVAFNLILAQAILVPLGSAIKDRRIIIGGGVLGGACIGIMLWVGHVALSSQMPGIVQFDIPMGQMVSHLGSSVQLLFILLIFAEIFTTFIADIYGITLQIEQRSRNIRPADWPQFKRANTSLYRNVIVIVLIIFCFFLSQFGFKPLLSTLYPLLGFLSLFWLLFIMAKRV